MSVDLSCALLGKNMVMPQHHYTSYQPCLLQGAARMSPALAMLTAQTHSIQPGGANHFVGRCRQPDVAMTFQVLLSENDCTLLNILAACAAVCRAARVSRIACNTCHILFSAFDSHVRQGMHNGHALGSIHIKAL